MTTGLVRWFSTAAAALLLFFTFRVFVPGLVNMHNDGALIGAIVLALTVPAAVFVGLYKVWTETFE